MTRDLKLLIDGEFTEGTGDEVYEVHSPVTGEHIANVPVASKADIDRAVAAARRATEEMRHWTAFERAELCLRIYELWQERIEDVARTLTLEQGKPYKSEAIDDIAESGDYFQIAAEDVKRLSGELIPTTERTRRMFTIRRPVGVWAAITPWNFPVMIPMEYVGPGLATGNAVIVKPPEFTCMALLEMAEVFVEAGAPPGAIQIIPGDGRIGEALVTHDGIDAIGFTGSSETGKRIVSQMGLKRSIMEMSGNGPLIVTGDADIAAAAEAAVYGAYYNAGQVCCATERVIVLDEVHDEFVDATLKAAQAVRLGDPFDDDTNMGPLNNRPTAEKMDRHIEDAADRGAEILMGGGRASGFPTDLYYEFTVIDRVPEDSLVAREESFGPVVPILTVPDDEEAVALANRSHLGLQAAVFTNDLSKAWWYADRIRSGTVVVNDSTDFWETFQPFGGAAGTDTGWGRQRIEEFTDLQTISFKLREI
ncbi:MAG: aldehyde dehydrogenase family protein [Actinomycetes bacterium]|jgi:succinate-semialdehyde dehydrogenase/glutarate-semialdehyde dehydrogenase|nr:aldehyde dehydrogenase [Acidimicrobiia bacterium]